MTLMRIPLSTVLAALSVCAVLTACGEKPSFVQTQQTVSRRSDGDSLATKSSDATADTSVSGTVENTAGEVDASSSSVSASSTDAVDNGGTGHTSNSGSGLPNEAGQNNETHSSDPSSNNGNPSPGGDTVSNGSATASGSDTSSGSDTAHPGDEGTPHLPNNDHNQPGPGGSDGDVVLPTRKTTTREMSFPAEATVSAEVSKTLDGAFLTQAITLKRSYYDHTKSVKQITRPVATDNFTQGSSGATVAEAFNQVAGRLLDILVVVDNSNSMAEEQANLATKLAPLLSFVRDADWQIGLVTSDPENPKNNCLNGLVKKSDANPEAKFSALVSGFGIKGSPSERPFLTAVNSLSGNCLSQPWIRKDSNVAVLLVSDEDNCSLKGNDCKDSRGNLLDYAKPSYLVDYLASIRQVGKTARVHGIIWHPSQTLKQCPSGWVDDLGEHRGYFLADAIAQTSGTWGSICDADYSATLANVSKNILVTLNSKFMLQQEPDMNSLHVFIGGIEQTSGFTVTGRLLEFATPPADGARITVSYRHGATPLFKTFPLRYKPLQDKLFVNVNGQLAQPSDYKIVASGGAAAVEFYDYPADKAAVVVSYTRDVPLNTQFVLEPLRPGSVRARVNGEQVSDYTVIEASGIVTFANPPAESAVIDFSYSVAGSPVLAYPFSVGGGAPIDLEVTDANTGAAVKFSYAAGVVTIDALEFVEGRKLSLKYDNAARQRFSIGLPNEPIASSVAAYGGTKVCVAPAINVSGTMVAVDGCGFADDVASVIVRYKFVSAHYQIFTFVADKLPGATDFQEWTVLVNDLPATGFTRVDNVVTFDQPLPAGAIVKIQLLQEDK